MKNQKQNKKPNQKQAPTFKKSFLKALMGFVAMLPMVIAVVGLVAIFKSYITPEMLSTLFGHGRVADIAIGTLTGAVSSGNGALSYVVGEGLMDQGVSVYAVSAFILAWVTLGFVQLPAEASVFGVRFTVWRNVLTLMSTVAVSYLAVMTTGALS
jgi:uncharacterized membrane protein YraQ (UPF0718 family)